jgi:hypothetical protein
MAITVEKTSWGVRLRDKPFDDYMEIVVEISKKRSVEHRISFTGTKQGIGMMDAATWNNALAAILTKAHEVGAEMKAKG